MRRTRSCKTLQEIQTDEEDEIYTVNSIYYYK